VSIFSHNCLSLRGTGQAQLSQASTRYCSRQKRVSARKNKNFIRSCFKTWWKL